MLGPSVFPDSNTEGLARGRVFRMLGPIPECLVLQYFRIHESYQIAWSFSIPRFTGHTRMMVPSAYPDTRNHTRMVGFSRFPGPNHTRTTDDPYFTFFHMIFTFFSHYFLIFATFWA